MSRPLVSIIVPTYDRRDCLGRCLASLAAQEHRPLQVLVVNDGGPDVEDIVAPFRSQLDLQYLGETVNRGLGAARNRGLEEARGEWIGYLDDDDVLLPHHLTALLDHARKSGAPVVYGDAHRVFYTVKDGQWSETGRRTFGGYDFDADAILVDNVAPPPCFLHQRDALESTGRFDDLYTHEDWDFWIRMSRDNAFSRLPRVTAEVSHVFRGGSMTNVRRFSFFYTRMVIYDRYLHHAKDRARVEAGMRDQIANIARQAPLYLAAYRKSGRLPVPDGQGALEDEIRVWKQIFEPFGAGADRRLLCQLSAEAERRNRVLQQLRGAVAGLAAGYRFLSLFDSRFGHRYHKRVEGVIDR